MVVSVLFVRLWSVAQAERERSEQLGVETRAAQAAEETARSAEGLANRRLYIARMNLVQRTWDDWNGEGFFQTLGEHLPKNQRGVERRGWEWYYWQRRGTFGHTVLKGHTGRVWGVAFSPDGTRIASASGDQTVKVWDVATGQEVRTLTGHSSSVQGVAFSLDDSRIASASGDQTVKVWDVATRQPVHTLEGHSGAVWGVAFSPDGSRIASASEDRSVKVWDAAAGEEVLTLKGHADGLGGVAFSPDGTRIASASVDGTVRVWDAGEATPESLVRDEARRLVSFLVHRLASDAEVRDCITRDQTRSVAVRAAALEMARGFWEMRVNRRAEEIVGPLFKRLLLHEDVLDALRSQPAADPEVQAACVKLAETWSESSYDCNEAAALLILKPGQPSASYERGVRLAQAACLQEPGVGELLSTLGIAQYRAGLVPEALATLTRSNALNEGKKPEDLAFLAMAHQRLGQPAEARAILARLRDLMRQERFVGGQGDQGRAFLAEAEGVVLYDPVFPADPFSR
jgi:hypothetical protein